MADVNTNTTTTTDDPNVVQTTATTAEPEVNKQTEDDPIDIKELAKQLAEQKAQYSKLKKQFDKESSEKAELKKQLRAKMTADEQAEIQRQEEEEERKAYIAGLELYKKTAEATARYALQGMNQEMAKQAAEAEISGDMDALADIQRKHAQQMVKDAQAEWIKSRPELNVGGNAGVKVTQEQFNNMNMIERTKLLEESPDVYKALLANS